MKTAFFGTPAFALPTLEHLVASSHEVALVVSRPDKPVGRRREMTSPPVVEYALEHGLEVAQPRKLQPLAAQLRDLGIDIAVVVAYGRLIPSALLETPPHGFVNLHPSLLPRHRGPSPIQWALACGDVLTGVTTMQLDAGMDTGPILLQHSTPIAPKEDSPALSQRLALVGAELVVQTLDGIEAHGLEPQPQPEHGVSVTPLLTREHGVVDWQLSAREIHNRFRAFTPWPGLATTLKGKRLKLLDLQPTSAPSTEEAPGTVFSVGEAGLSVACGNSSALLLTRLQLEGRRPLDAEQFLLGEQVRPGEHLG